MKRKGWQRDKHRHAMASRGVSTTAPSIVVDEHNRTWFESQGIIGDMVSLMNLVGFEDLTTREAKGYNKETFRADGSQINVYPSCAAHESVRWLNKEWDEAPNQPRKRQLIRLAERASKEIGRRIHNKPLDVRQELHKSTAMYKGFINMHKKEVAG